MGQAPLLSRLRAGDARSGAYTPCAGKFLCPARRCGFTKKGRVPSLALRREISKQYKPSTAIRQITTISRSNRIPVWVLATVITTSRLSPQHRRSRFTLGGNMLYRPNTWRSVSSCAATTQVSTPPGVWLHGEHRSIGVADMAVPFKRARPRCSGDLATTFLNHVGFDKSSQR